MPDRVAVTGADGFIGSHLVEALVRQGARVRALTQYSARGGHGWLDTIRLPADVECCHFELAEPELNTALLADCGCIFHLGALASLPWSLTAPRQVMAVNLGGTHNILQAARQTRARVILMSTSVVYGHPQYLPVDEKHPLQALTPYAASKIAAEQLALAYYHAFQVAVVIARPFNIYGPRQSGQAVVPTLCRQLIAGQTQLAVRSWTPRRDFIYVADAVDALIRLAWNEDATGRAVNIAGQQDLSIADIAGMLATAAGVREPVLQAAGSGNAQNSGANVDCQRGDNGILRRLTGWQPSTDPAAGLALTYRHFIDQAKAGHCR